MSLSKELVEILRCPESGAKLIYTNNSLVSLDQNSRKKFPVFEGTPLLLIEKSTTLIFEEWYELVKEHINEA